MEKDGGSLRVCGSLGLYDCMVTEYCVHKIKGLMIAANGTIKVLLETARQNGMS